MQSTGKYTATLNVKLPGNAKTDPDYDLRLNQEDCTTVELKMVTAKEWPVGGELKPFMHSFPGYDAETEPYNAFTFQKTTTEAISSKYDTKVGMCTCDTETGICEADFDPKVEAGFI